MMSCNMINYNIHPKQELLTLLTLNFYSIVYYNSEIRHLPIASPGLKQMLLSASAHAPKSTQKHVDPLQSFVTVPKECNRATH